jgi:Immunity protein 49
MTTTNTHPDLAYVREYYERTNAIRARIVQNARSTTEELGTVIARASAYAACEHHLGLQDRVPGSLRLVVDAGVALFRCALAPGQPVTYVLDGQVVTGESHVSESEAHAGRWLHIFEAARVLRDEAAVRELCAVPVELPLRSSSIAAPSVALWLRAMHTFGETGRFDAALLMDALRATDPDKLPEDARDYALYIEVPMMDVYYRVAIADAAALERALGDALDKHARYFGRAENARQIGGIVSWPLSAAVAIAADRDLAVTATSRYLMTV